MEIAEDKPANKISVKEIAANCGMTTATFYNHFESKYDLMAWVNNRDTDAATDKFGYENDWLQTIRLYIDALCRHRDFYRNSLQNTYGRESQHMRTFYHFKDHAVEHLKKLHGMDEFSPKVAFSLDFYFQGLSHVMVNWLLDKEPVPAEELAQWCVESMPHEVEWLFLEPPKKQLGEELR